jgi:hypothetical protein
VTGPRDRNSACEAGSAEFVFFELCGSFFRISAAELQTNSALPTRCVRASADLPDSLAQASSAPYIYTNMNIMLAPAKKKRYNAGHEKG